MPAPSARAGRRSGGAVVLVALITMLAGCGSAHHGNFVAGANAICASALRATRSIPPPSLTTGSAQDLTALTRYVSSVLPVVQSEARQLRALRRSLQKPRERAALASYVGALNQTIGDYRTLAAAAGGNDAQGVASALAALRASPAPTIAAQYGLRSCGAAGATVS